MGFPLTGVREVPDALRVLTLANDSQAYCKSAEKVLGRFECARKLFLLWAPACACVAPYLGCAKFVGL